MPEISLDRLAAMIKQGFDEVRVDSQALRVEMLAGFKLLSEQVSDLDRRLTPIENLLTSNRIDRLEDDMRIVKTKLGIG